MARAAPPQRREQAVQGLGRKAEAVWVRVSVTSWGVFEGM